MSVVKSRDVATFAKMLHVKQEARLVIPSRRLSVNFVDVSRGNSIPRAIKARVQNKKRRTERNKISSTRRVSQVCRKFSTTLFQVVSLNLSFGVSKKLKNCLLSFDKRKFNRILVITVFVSKGTFSTKVLSVSCYIETLQHNDKISCKSERQRECCCHDCL